MTDVGIKLYYEDTESGKYKKLVSVVSAPATGSTPSTIENTTLDSPQKTYDMDRPDNPQMDFTYNYYTDGTNHYQEVKAHISTTEAHNYLLAYPDGAGVQFKAYGSTWINSVSRGSEIECTVSFVLPEPIEDVDDVSSLVEE
jgi:hypothetical protein